MNDLIDLIAFNSMIDICNMHKMRIQTAHEKLIQSHPFTAEKIENLDLFQLGMAEILINRFSKLQDTIGEKIFPNILLLLGESIYQTSFIDRLNMLEKIGIIEDANDWQEYRNARNASTHEYPDNLKLMAENLNNVMTLSQKLIIFWDRLHQLIIAKIG